MSACVITNLSACKLDPKLKVQYRNRTAGYNGVTLAGVYISSKYMLILQSDLQNGVVIKTYNARLISLPASCVFYVLRQVFLKKNM